LFKRRSSKDGAAAVAERHPAIEETAAIADHFEAIDRLNEVNRGERSAAVEHEIRRRRNLAGMELLETAPPNPVFPEPAATLPARGEQSRIPELTPAELTPGVLRAAILESGCLLVRGLMDPGDAERMAADVDRVHEIRSALGEGEADPEGLYDELEPEPPFIVWERTWIEQGGGVLAVDSPHLLFRMLEAFESAGLRSVITDYLGERPAISAQKCTLRKATPDVAGGWHQDGKFLGDVRALNVWVSLSRCGDVAPSMDVVPARLDHYVETGGEGVEFKNQISQATAEEAAGETGIVRPIFEPGDALLFDELFLHQTGSDPSMPNARYAIESWFFGASAYPDSYAPIAF
jgi:hypothetical protein